MNNIIEGLYWNHAFKNRYPSLYKKMNLDCGSKGFRDFAEKLYLLNQAAVMQRYPSYRSEFIQMPKFEWVSAQVTDIQLLKSLRCLRYQCSEGTVVDEPLYLWLENVINCLMEHIISKMPEYDKAKWD